jgi:hypothetical protein
MKKLIILSGTMLLLLCSNIMLQAQTGRNSVYSVQIRYLDHQMDSTERAALVGMLQEYHTKVTMKNEYVLSERNMWHFWTSDSREFATITEFADWSAIEKAGDRDSELEKQAWPDAKQRADYMKKMSSYFTHHKDAIFSGVPTLTK